MGEKDHFVSTVWGQLNWGDGFGSFELAGAGTRFGRGGLTVEYVEDPDDYFTTGLPFLRDVNREYYVSAVDPQQIEWWTLEENPDVLLRVLELPTHHPDSHYIEERAIRDFIAEYGQLTDGFLREAEDPFWEMSGNLNDPRNIDFVFNFSEAAQRLRYAARLPLDDPETIPALLLLIDESPAPSLYRALLLQLLERAFAGLGGPKECAGCHRWFFETSNPSTAVHQAGWKRRDAKYHSTACMKAAAERRRRARIAKARQAPVSGEPQS